MRRFQNRSRRVVLAGVDFRGDDLAVVGRLPADGPFLGGVVSVFTLTAIHAEAHIGVNAVVNIHGAEVTAG